MVFDRQHAKLVVQVCHKIDDNNFDRELNGLLEAMKFFKLSTGTIATTAQKDNFELDGRVVELVPAHEFMISV